MTNTLRDQFQSALGSAYTLERELGGGGMSHVFVAGEAALDRRVVVKVLMPTVVSRASAVLAQGEAFGYSASASLHRRTRAPAAPPMQSGCWQSFAPLHARIAECITAPAWLPR